MSLGGEIVGALLGAGVIILAFQCYRERQDHRQATDEVERRLRQHRSWRRAGRTSSRGVKAALRNGFRRVTFQHQLSSCDDETVTTHASTPRSSVVSFDDRPNALEAGTSDKSKDKGEARPPATSPPSMSTREKKARWLSRLSGSKEEATTSAAGPGTAKDRRSRFAQRRSDSCETKEPEVSALGRMSCPICLERFAGDHKGGSSSGSGAGRVPSLPPVDEETGAAGDAADATEAEREAAEAAAVAAAAPEERMTPAQILAAAAKRAAAAAMPGSAAAAARAVGARLEKDSVDVMVLPCGHAFHESCIDQWITENVTCPMCKQNVEKLAAEQAAAGASKRVWPTADNRRNIRRWNTM